MSVEWRWSAFDELSGAQLYEILRLRQQVFVVEQVCPFLDCDNADQAAQHLQGREGGELMAYLRLHPPGRKAGEPVLARVVTAPARRGTGLGRELLGGGIARANQLYPGQAIRIGAQARLQAFYQDFGFRACSAPYLEDGIVHLEMLRPAPAAHPAPI